MRKLLSILLLAIFALPLLSPLLALGTDSEAGVPICCRRNGAHHCLMNMGGNGVQSSDHAHLSAPVAQCPYRPGIVPSPHLNLLSPMTSAAIFAALVSHPSGSPQTASRRRIARDRSRLKRGPPAHSLRNRVS